MNSEQPLPFHLTLLPAAKQQLRRILEQAKPKGVFDKMSEAALRIDRRLQTDPLSAGEALYHLGPPKMQVRLTADGPLCAEFAILIDSPSVFVRRFHSMMDLST